MRTLENRIESLEKRIAAVEQALQQLQSEGWRSQEALQLACDGERGENTILTISTGNFVFLLAEAFSFGLALANAIWTHTRYADKPDLKEISSAPTFANCVCVLTAAVLLSDILDVLQVFQ